MDRTKGIGGSDAARIMAGDWLALWQEKTGRKEPEDLSDVLQVQIGIVTEELNRRWFERKTGLEVGLLGCADLVHPDHGFMIGNIDGWVLDGVIECKHCSAFAKDADIIGRYYPQVQHYLAVTQTPRGFLSVIYGNHKWEFYQVEADAPYQAELIERESAFWRHVENDTPPKDEQARPVSIALDAMRTVDMTGNNEWASFAVDWLETHAAAKRFDDATKCLKALIEDDVRLASGHGVKVSRARNGALSVREAA
jgi:predicted phage-related endonuclease